LKYNYKTVTVPILIGNIQDVCNNLATEGYRVISMVPKVGELGTTSIYVTGERESEESVVEQLGINVF
jgi:hypothetical protein